MIKILVPTDFSLFATYAENAALQLAHKLGGGTVYFYHQTYLPPSWKEMSEREQNYFPLLKKQTQIIKQNIKRLVGKGNNYNNVDVVAQYASGDLIENIVNYASTQEIDLILMGSHGTSGYNEWVLGSNTQKVVRKVNCPVLTIKSPTNLMDIKNIAFVSTFDNNLKEGFKKVIHFAKQFEANIHLLTIDTPSFFGESQIAILESMRTFKKMVNNEGLSCFIHSEKERTTYKGIKKYAIEHDIDIVAMATHGRGPIGRFIFGSVAETMVNHLDSPLLTFKINQQTIY